MNQRLLAIDTSSPFLFLGLYSYSENQSPELLRSVCELMPRDHDSWLKNRLTDFMLSQNLAAPEILALGRGPGSFTSLRTGFAFARTLAMLWKIPLVTFSSYQFFKGSFGLLPEEELLVRANKFIYFGRWQGEIEALPAEQWQSRLAGRPVKTRVGVWNLPWSVPGRPITENWPEGYTIMEQPDRIILPELSGESGWENILPEYGLALAFKEKKVHSEIKL